MSRLIIIIVVISVNDDLSIYYNLTTLLLSSHKRDSKWGTKNKKIKFGIKIKFLTTKMIDLLFIEKMRD
jgi:hypothetical protein